MKNPGIDSRINRWSGVGNEVNISLKMRLEMMAYNSYENMLKSQSEISKKHNLRKLKFIFPLVNNKPSTIENNKSGT